MSLNRRISPPIALAIIIILAGLVVAGIFLCQNQVDADLCLLENLPEHKNLNPIKTGFLQ